MSSDRYQVWKVGSTDDNNSDIVPVSDPAYYSWALEHWEHLVNRELDKMEDGITPINFYEVRKVHPEERF